MCCNAGPINGQLTFIIKVQAYVQLVQSHGPFQYIGKVEWSFKEASEHVGLPFLDAENAKMNERLPETLCRASG